jgi:hypothetical protein
MWRNSRDREKFVSSIDTYIPSIRLRRNPEKEDVVVDFVVVDEAHTYPT